jgi:hypothetical protein
MSVSDVLELVRGLKELRVREANVSSDGVHVEVVFDVESDVKDDDKGIVVWSK